MDRFWASAGVTLGKRWKVVLALTALITVVLALGLPRLDFATGQDSYLNEGSQVAEDNEAYQELFGGQAVVTLFTGDILELFTPHNIGELRALEQDLREGGHVYNVVSPLTALEFTQALVEGGASGAAGGMLLRAIEREDDPDIAGLRLADAQETLRRSQAAGEPTLENREWVEFLLFDNQGEIRRSLRPFFPDPGHAQMVVRLPGNASIEVEGAASEAVVAAVEARSFEGFDVLTTGAPVLLKDINDYLKGGMATLGGIAVLIMMVVLAVVFRVRWRLLPLAVVLVGVLWAFSILGWIGVDLSLVTISGLPILIGMGVDFAIQVHNRVEEEVVLDKEAHPMSETLRNLAPGLIIATVAAVVAFLALQRSLVPMIRDFGVLLAIGIAVLCAVGIVLPTAVLGIREYTARTTSEGGHTRMERLVVGAGSTSQRFVPVLLVAAVVLFGAGLLAEGGFQLQTDPEEWVNQDTQVIRDIDRLRSETGSSSELGVYIQADDVLTDEVGAFIDGLASQQLADNPETLLTASSLTTSVSGIIQVPGATPLAPTGEDLRAAYEVAPPDIRRSTISEDRRAANLIFRAGRSSLEERAELVDEMRAEIDPPAGVSATPSGLAVVGAGLLRNLEANRAVLTYLALALVFLWLLVRFASITRTLLSLVPVLIALGASSVVVYLAGFELSPLTVVSGPLVIANCTEFSVLILTRYLEERRRGLTSREATDLASARTGRAFVASALTTIGGFAVLAFSALPLLRDFGIIVALNVGVALVSALVVLPPLLVWADDKGWLRPGPKGAPVDVPPEPVASPA